MGEFLQLAEPVIIATKGLPCAGKSEIARCISGWMRCPVLYIDHFLDMLSLESDHKWMPSQDEAETLHRLAFDALCKAASDYLLWGNDALFYAYKSVVVKSRLSSTFELARLLQLAKDCGCGTILIIEFRTDNEHRIRTRLEHKVMSGEQKEWYKPRSWNDIDKFRDDYCVDPQSNNWDLHLRDRLLDSVDDTAGLPRVKRLVLDPFDHLFLVPHPGLPIDFENIARFLLLALLFPEKLDSEDILLLESRYMVVRFAEFGRYIKEKELRDALSKERNKYHCPNCTFKYWEELQADADCEVCEELVFSGQSAYACYFCTLTLHKTCAELPVGVTIEGFQDLEFLRLYPRCDGEGLISERHACKNGCDPFFTDCVPCLHQVHLKCRVLPTILNHDCHEHFLSIVFYHMHECKACGTDSRLRGSYRCYICAMTYDIDCLSLVRELEHEHGGHKHTMKLAYSHDGFEKEEDIWCGICYKDMDSQYWFYSCQECPYFVLHPHCVSLSGCLN